MANMFLQKNIKDFVRNLINALRNSYDKKKKVSFKNEEIKPVSSFSYDLSPIPNRGLSRSTSLFVDETFNYSQANVSRQASSKEISFVNLGEAYGGEAVKDFKRKNPVFPSKKSLYIESEGGLFQDKTFIFEEKILVYDEMYTGMTNEYELLEFLLMAFWGVRIKKFATKQLAIR